MSDTTTQTRERADGSLPYLPSELITKRLVLRPLTKDDLDSMHAEYQKRKAVVRYLRWEVHDHDEPSRNLVKRLAMDQLTHDGDGLIYAVELPDAAGEGENGRAIGDVSVFLKSKADAQFEVGWVFHPAAHGHGFATEAAHALLDLCFNTLGAHRVFAELDARNEASARLCELVGMRQEALLRERELVDGEWHDMAIYAVLDSEYKPPAIE
ncbi:GNAT family N-acetyltransferase [Rathayibacter soli]|uniref:GNAT family N-acetyltransferase n=1 Tax=Rathayibacter soli TaxID=3144168 RepID=UPI0027E3E2C2|nr:GNAT family protein [Glaciibacter superstes]